MPDVPLQIAVAAFRDMDAASIVLVDLKQAKRMGMIDLMDAAVITKDASGKTKIRETNDMGAGKGATIGALIGAVLSLIAGPLGWMALGGGIIGGIAAKLSDSGFPQDQLAKLAARLTPGSSALVVVIEQKWLAQLEAAFQRHDAEMLAGDVETELANEVSTGSDVVYTVATTGDAIFAGRSKSKHDGNPGELIMHDNSYANRK
jgi:uncharacterized membrane protein